MFLAFARPAGFAASLVAVCALLLSSCADEPSSPESQLRDTVDAIVASVESADVQQVGEHLSDDYRDERHPDKRSAIATIFWYLRQHASIHLLTLVREMEIDENSRSASSVVMVAMAGVPIESREVLISVKADFYRFDITWLYDDGQWLVTGGRWQRVGLEDF